MNDLLEQARKAALEVRKEGPSRWERFIVWYRERQCSNGHHLITGWTWASETKVYRQGADPATCLPMKHVQVWRGKCKYCGAPDSRMVEE